MATFTRTLRRVISRGDGATAAPPQASDRASGDDAPPVDIAPNDPIMAVFQASSGAVDLDALEIASPAKDALRAAGVKLVVPLVSQGELIGLLNLGPRRSEQEYSGDDRKLLDDLAAHAAPAVRVAQLAKQQEVEARERERMEHELRVAQLIQQNFLPRHLPDIAGWHVNALYRPAREVGGDFYDFIELPEGWLGLVCADVTDHGVPAALVMASTRTLLRLAAQRFVHPGEVLQQVNDQLCDEMPANMFVTCLYAILDPRSGRLRYANAGHNLPYIRTRDGVFELRATGMPLGLMPGMRYEEMNAEVHVGEGLLLYSDGIVEAHSVQTKEMFGFPRMQRTIGEYAPRGELIEHLMKELETFTGPGWEQEDDVTLVALERTAGTQWTLAEFELPSQPGNEREAMARVADAVAPLQLDGAKLERLKTAVAEATMNAMEHGNEFDPERPAQVRVMASDTSVLVRIRDLGGAKDIPPPVTPDIEAKLAGEQSPRGWGLFLIKNMVDEMHVSRDQTHHTVELVMHLRRDRGDGDGSG